MTYDLPWFKFYPSDFMGSGKVQIMGATHLGVYLALLCYSWQEGPIPDDPDVLWRIARCSPDEFKAAWPTVRRCWRETPEGLVNDRLEKERADALRRRAKASKAASAKAESSAPSSAPSSAGSTPPRSAWEVPYSEAQNSEDQKELPERSGENARRLVEAKVRALYGWNGSEGTDPILMRAFEEQDDRDRCLTIAVQRLVDEERAYNGRFFRRVLQSVIDEQRPDEPEAKGRVF